VCCSVLQYFAMYCSVLHQRTGHQKHSGRAAGQGLLPVCCNVLQCVAVCGSVLQCVAMCCNALQCCSVLQCVAICCCSVLKCVVVCYGVLHCVAVCCTKEVGVKNI